VFPRVRRAALLVIVVDLVVGPASALATPRVLGLSTEQAIDCVGPVDQAAPGTPEWDELNVANAFCARERHQDKRAHRVLEATAPADAYREPTRHDGVRFRYDTTTIGGLEAEVYRPCGAGTCPGSPDVLETFEPPYPAVVIFHGGASNKRLHWWASQPLAEAGYLVVAFDSPAGPTLEDASTVVDWLHGGDPLAADFDGERLGIAGHSRGGVVVSEFGQRDPRVSAIVSWDRAQSTPLPADLALETPTLFMFADYNCQNVPVCEPEVYETAPDPDGPGNKGDDFLLLEAEGVDSMQIPLRAALHLDWVPSQLSGNRYAEPVTVYYTLAWFDRYVRGGTEPEVAADAFERLTAAVFDDSADRHNVSQGIFDPDLASSTDPYAGNVPYSIAGLRVADRLSFYFRAKCRLTVPGSSETVVSTDVRTEGCEAPPGAEARPGAEEATGASDSGSSGSATGVVVIGAVVVAALLLGALLIAYRRSVHGRAASNG
jgi:dienelactone hydrolase